MSNACGLGLLERYIKAECGQISVACCAPWRFIKAAETIMVLDLRWLRPLFRRYNLHLPFALSTIYAIRGFSQIYLYIKPTTMQMPITNN
ncbi:hypothetical protein LIPSTDRAFT_230622 [Lipomyces starkeyi NRRL Y-11557]|uniref:Uncharacterized protein n=1 Tax=Lipomyces starkeyi NRRL Y-11557 TaxID=675824 RepID=A0A1E3QAZ5_LIPST|nr:hypothetical protein LIPSTDRAFT_230622 [Lipomyces starkeyi NRRL Y-11557]